MSGAIVLDRSARLLDSGRAIVGGDPPRAIRLTSAGAGALRSLLSADGPPSPAGARDLARRLIDAGMAHPRPTAVVAAEVTVIVPVRDRATALDRCLAAAMPAPVLVVDDGSRDRAAVATVCARHGATLIRRDAPGGPGVARNAALARVETELVAFLDSDCVPEPGWLEPLVGVLADPRVGAAAPRIRPLAPGTAGEPPAPASSAGPPPGRFAGPPPATAPAGPVARFAAARSPLDLGPDPGAVRPGGRIAYVPTAALLARRAALGDGFDPGLRHGEDVDLVWRMLDAGWRVRYEPAATVRHAEPARLTALLARRYRYGTAAGPLARRHPGRLAPVLVHPPSVAVIALAASRHPGAALIAAAVTAARRARRIRRVGVGPLTATATATALVGRGLLDSAAALGRAATMLAPVLLAAGLAPRATRPAAAALALAGPLHDHLRIRPDLDPLRFAALSVADDVAYGAGVWAGAARARTPRPLLPALARVRASPDGASPPGEA